MERIRLEDLQESYVSRQRRRKALRVVQYVAWTLVGLGLLAASLLDVS